MSCTIRTSFSVFVKNVGPVKYTLRESSNTRVSVMAGVNLVHVVQSFYMTCFDSEIYAVSDLSYTCPYGKVLS